MPEAPTAAAMEAAAAMHPAAICGRCQSTGRSLQCGWTYDWAVAMDAYAAERMAERDPTYDQLRAERDAALAKLEAAEAELQGLREIAASPPTLPIMERSLLSSDRGKPLSPSVLTPNWPADLLAAVQIAVGHCGHCSAAVVHSGARATFKRYGLLKEAR